MVTCVQMVSCHMLSPCSCHRSVNILAISGITSPNLCANPPPLDMAREKVTRTSPQSNQALQGRHTTDEISGYQWDVSGLPDCTQLPGGSIEPVKLQYASPQTQGFALR